MLVLPVLVTNCNLLLAPLLLLMFEEELLPIDLIKLLVLHLVRRVEHYKSLSPPARVQAALIA